MKVINIPNDLYTELLEKALELGYRSPVDVIRFYHSKEKKKEVSEKKGLPGINKNHYDLVSKGGSIPQGTKLRCKYKGRRFEGVVDNGAILLDGKRFDSPSNAAKYVARLQGAHSPSINGWTFWEYFDEGTDLWIILRNLQEGSKSESNKTEDLICECKSKGAYAIGKQNGKGLTVFKDSKASPEETPSQLASNRKKREQLRKEGVLRKNGDHFVFTREYTFNTLSAAAGVVLGRSANGKIEWQPKRG